MPRVNFVQKARKDNPVAKAGESYYWWKFRYGGKHYSLTRPRESQLTQSEFLGAMYSLLEEIQDFTLKAGTGPTTCKDCDGTGEKLSCGNLETCHECDGLGKVPDTSWRKQASEFIESLQSQLEEMESGQQDRLDNMPDQLQDGNTGELLQDRINECSIMMADLDNSDPEDFEVAEEWLEAIRQLDYNGG